MGKARDGGPCVGCERASSDVMTASGYDVRKHTCISCFDEWCDWHKGGGGWHTGKGGGQYDAWVAIRQLGLLMGEARREARREVKPKKPPANVDPSGIYDLTGAYGDDEVPSK